MVAAQCRTDTALTSCCSGGCPRQPWSSGLAPLSRFHSSVPLFPFVPVPNRLSRLRGLSSKNSSFFPESRRDQEEGGGLDPHEEVRLPFEGSRRDREEGDGAGPSREPRRDQEQGGGVGLRKLNFFSFSCSSTAVLWILSL